jgi:signal transduction histidine kinase
MFESGLRACRRRSGVVVATIATVPTVALMLGHEHGLSRLVSTVALASYALILVSAVLTYFHWRLSSDGRPGSIDVRLAGWLAFGLTIGAVDGLLQLTSGTERDDLRPVAAQLALTLVLCVVAVLCERVDIPTDPAVACTVAAAAITGTFSVVLWVTPKIELSGASATLATTAVTLAGLVLALVVLHLRQVSSWARRRVASAAVLVTAAQSVATIEHGNAAPQVFAVAAFILGALILCAMTYDLLRESLLEQQAEFARVQGALNDVRSAVLEDRELLHEVGATLAGLTTASEVMRAGKSVPAHRRARIEEMMVAELARLGRLVAARADDAPTADVTMLAIDDVVRPVVVSHQERQRHVVWTPCGQEAPGDADELAEVCSILLENAARHARGAVVRLSVSAGDDEIVVICADEGPGVPAGVRDRLFEVEAKGEESGGQGLGLAIAQRLASTRGGSIELVDVQHLGAVFVARLPWKERIDVAAGNVA